MSAATTEPIFRSARSIRAYIAMAHAKKVPVPGEIESLRAEHLAAILREKIVEWSDETAAKGGKLNKRQVDELCRLLRSLV